MWQLLFLAVSFVEGDSSQDPTFSFDIYPPVVEEQEPIDVGGEVIHPDNKLRTIIIYDPSLEGYYASTEETAPGVTVYHLVLRASARYHNGPWKAKFVFENEEVYWKEILLVVKVSVDFSVNTSVVKEDEPFEFSVAIYETYNDVQSIIIYDPNLEQYNPTIDPVHGRVYYELVIAKAVKSSHQGYWKLYIVLNSGEEIWKRTSLIVSTPGDYYGGWRGK